MIRVLVVDDHKLFRQGIYALLSSAPDIQIVGEARDGQEAIEFVQRLEPDVILMDLEMPRVGGLQATRILRDNHCSCKILVLSMRTNEKDVQKAAESGAHGYLVKNCSREELIGGIRAVLEGKTVVSPEIAQFFKTNEPMSR